MKKEFYVRSKSLVEKEEEFQCKVHKVRRSEIVEVFECKNFSSSVDSQEHVVVLHGLMFDVCRQRRELEELLATSEDVFDWAQELFDPEEVQDIMNGSVTDFMEYYSIIGRYWVTLDALLKSEAYVRWAEKVDRRIDHNLLFLLYDVLVPMETTIRYIERYKKDQIKYVECLYEALCRWEDCVL